MYQKYLKRPLDLIVALTGLIILSPIFLVIAVLVKVKLGSPIVFRQQRPGLNESIFTLYKFRTMTNERDGEGKLLPDEQRLIPFGRFLRSTSLDELPELWNILRGDMSLVGPRPLLAKYVPLYNPQQRKRHSVKPGLTGLAQINGRNEISWEEKFKLDLDYISNISFRNDVAIFFKTVVIVFKRQGIGSGKAMVVEEFEGN